MNKKTIVIFDIEASCEDVNVNPSYEMETIEIGAVKVQGGEVIDTFQTFVKPTLVSELTPYCIELTGITYNYLENAPKFEDAIVEFFKFAYGSTIYSAGNFDRNMFLKELKEKGSLYTHDLIADVIRYSHKDLKKHYTRVMSRPRAGMYGMADELGIDMLGAEHRALDDALNLTKIYIRIEEERARQLNKVFNDSRTREIMQSFNNTHKHHLKVSQQEGGYYVVNSGSDFTLKMDKIMFLDTIGLLILDDYRKRKAKYITSSEFKVLEKFTV